MFPAGGILGGSEPMRPDATGDGAVAGVRARDVELDLADGAQETLANLLPSASPGSIRIRTAGRFRPCVEAETVERESFELLRVVADEGHKRVLRGRRA